MSWQALTNDNDSIKIEFTAITELVKSINLLLQKKIYESKKKTALINAQIQNKILGKEPEILKTNNEIVEQKIVNDILNNDKTDYTPQYNFPTVKTDEEAERDRINENTNYIATELVKKERDIQIIDDITKKNQIDLIRSIADPGNGIITYENVTATDYTRNDNNEPVQPQLDQSVLNVMQEMVKLMVEQVAVMDSIPPPLEEIPQNNPVQIITQPDLQDIITKDEPDLTDIIKIKDEIADVISKPDLINISNPGFTRFISAAKDISDEISWTDSINIPPNNLIPNPEDIGLIPLVPTGDRQTDERNYNEDLDTLQQIRPDLFISEDEKSDNDSDNDSDGVVVIPKVEPKTEPDFTPFVDVDGNVLIKTETDDTPLVDVNGDILIKTETNETPTDIYIGSDIDSSDDDQTIPYIGDSDTETITYATTPRDRRNEIYRKSAKKRALKTLAKKRAKKLQSIKKKNNKKTHILVPTDVSITSDDPFLGNPNVSTILPPQIKTEDDFDIDFNVTNSQIVWDKDNTDLVPLEFDTDKIVMTDGGDVILTEPDNMQVEEKQLVPLSNDTIMLPPEENMTDVISTRNIVVKRKQPDVSAGQIKKIKNETDISITNTVKHPIFIKMEKQKKADERIVKSLASGKPLEIKIKGEVLAIEGPDEVLAIEGPDELLAIEGPPGLPALMPPTISGPLPSVDSETMQRLPWIEFNVIIDNTDKYNRKQAIFDLLQANMPNLGDDLYYIDHNPETNVFSIKKDEKADEIQDLVESIRVIDARLAIEILSKRERNYFLKVKAFKIGELRKIYKANTLADILENKLSQSEKDELENEVLLKLKELNKYGDRYYFEFNEATQEFEILLDSEVRINAIVFAVMQIDKVINNVSTTHTRRLELMTEKDKLLDYLKSKGAKLLADSLR